MSVDCVVLQKNRSDSLKNILLKIKETLNKKDARKVWIRISGISSKEFAFSVFPVWPLYKETKELTNDFQLESVSFINEEETTPFQIPPICKSLFLNILMLKLFQVRANELHLSFQQCLICHDASNRVDNLIKSLSSHGFQENNLRLDILKHRDIFLVDGKFISLVQLPETLKQKLHQPDHEPQNGDYFMREVYPGIVRRSCLVTWKGKDLEVSYEPQQEQERLQKQEQLQKQKQLQEQKKLKGQQQWRKQRSKYISNHLKLMRSQNSCVILPRYYYRILEQIRRIKQTNSNSFMNALLVTNDDRDYPRTIILSLMYSRTLQFQKYFADLKQKYRIVQVKIPVNCILDFNNQSIKSFVQREFCCRVKDQRISVILEFESRLRELLEAKQSQQSNVHKAVTMTRPVQLHELNSLWEHGEIMSQAKIHQKTLVRQVCETRLEVGFNDKTVFVTFAEERPFSLAKRKLLRYPNISQNVFEHGVSLEQHAGEGISEGMEPVIQYQEEDVKTRQQVERYIDLVVKVVFRCEDKCQLVIVSESNCTLDLLRKRLQLSNSKCKQSKIVLEYKGIPTLIESITNRIDEVLQSKSSTFKNIISTLEEKKAIQKQLIVRDLQELSLTVKGNRVVFKNSTQYQKLINYILNR